MFEYYIDGVQLYFEKYNQELEHVGIPNKYVLVKLIVQSDISVSKDPKYFLRQVFIEILDEQK